MSSTEKFCEWRFEITTEGFWTQFNKFERG